MSDPNAWQLPTFFTADKKSQLRYQFPKLDLVSHQNFSQCYQDMFVLCMTDGKPYGTFVEIGAGHPVISNNTALLESRFADHPNPVMHGIIDSLLTDTKTSCVLLGQRNIIQAKVAATLGQKMSDTDSDWVKNH